MIKKTKRQKRVDLTCILTGKVLPKQSYNKLLKQSLKLKFDSVEEYINFYIDKDARKLLSSGMSELEIRKRYNCKETKTIPFKILKCFVKKFKSKAAIERKRQRRVADEYKRSPIVLQWKKTEPIDMVKNKSVCADVTQISCWRPDIYLDFGCSECILQENCACPIKNLKKQTYARNNKRLKSV